MTFNVTDNQCGRLS